MSSCSLAFGPHPNHFSSLLYIPSYGVKYGSSRLYPLKDEETWNGLEVFSPSS